MCDCLPGSLMVSYRHEDGVAEGAFYETFDRFGPENLAERVPERTVELIRTLEHEYWQVTVPPGAEGPLADAFRRTYLTIHIDRGASSGDIREILNTPGLVPIVQQEALATAGSLVTPGGSAAFSFTAEHAQYRAALNLTGTSRGSYGSVVGVVDSGWGSPATVKAAIVGETDLTTSPCGPAAPDTYGHGTVVLAIIDDIAPGTDFRVYRVGDATIREWTFLAGLATAAPECDIVNASLGFGLKDRSCATCGRDFGTSRSFVFERLLHHLLGAYPNLTYVGAAGNQSAGRPCYPARFSPTICVASTDVNGRLSTFSNYGEYDENDNPHPCLVLAPGGDRLSSGSGADVYVASYSNRDWRGTSFATAYVSGLISEHRTRTGGRSRDQVIAELKVAAMPAMVPGYLRSDHGSGFAQRL
jgi:hypothetical protein